MGAAIDHWFVIGGGTQAFGSSRYFAVLNSSLLWFQRAVGMRPRLQ